MAGDAPDILRPPDPYGLIGNNWPLESEAAYHAAERAADAAASLTMQAAGKVGATAGDVDAEMHGKTATKLADRLDSAAAALRQAASNYGTAATWMQDAGSDVADAKSAIVGFVVNGTEDIEAAEAQEAEGKSPDPSSSDLTTEYRNKISGEKTKLDTALSGIGHALAGGTPAEGAPAAPTHVNIPTQPLADQPGIQQPAVQQVAAHTGGGDRQQLPPPKELPPIQQPGAQQPGLSGHHGGHGMPGMPGSPSAGSPGGTSGTGGLGSPGGLGGQGGLGQNAMNPSTLNPLGIGNPNANPAAGTGAGAPAASAPSTSSPGALGDASLTAGMGGLSGLSGIGPALTGIPIAGAAGAHGAAAAAASGAAPGGPAVPMGTGSTPGVAPLAPFGPSGGSVTPASPGVPSGSPAPAGTPVAAPGPLQGAPQGPAPAPKVDGIAAAVRHWETAQSARSDSSTAPLIGVVGGEEEKTVAPTTYVDELPEAEATAHLVLAALRLAYGQAGWQQPIAVAVTTTEEGTATLFATADGLSLIPRGLLIPAGVIPLCDHSVQPGVEALGYAYPTVKLAGLPGLVALVSSDETHRGTHQTDDQAIQLLEAGAAPIASGFGRQS